MKKLLALAAFMSAFLLMGCCCNSNTFSGTSTTSTICPYGTYGSSCSEICTKLKGTEFETPSCFTDCTAEVQSEGLGDATTCCSQNIRQGCATMCTNYISQVSNQYGSVMDPGEAQEMLTECNGECLGGYLAVGVDVDSVCAIGISQYA